MSQLVVFLYGADVAVHYNAVEVDAAAVVPLRELRAALVEVTEPSVPNLGVRDYVHCCCGTFGSTVLVII